MVKICADCHNTCKECKTANTIDKCTLCNYPSATLITIGDSDYRWF